MVYKCASLKQEFETKAEMFKALKANEKLLIKQKKGNVYKSAEKGQIAPINVLKKLDDTTKSVLNLKEDYIYPVINTTRYLDSHDDVHFDGLWKKSIQEQQGNYSRPFVKGC